MVFYKTYLVLQWEWQSEIISYNIASNLGPLQWKHIKSSPWRFLCHFIWCHVSLTVLKVWHHRISVISKFVHAGIMWNIIKFLFVFSQPDFCQSQKWEYVSNMIQNLTVLACSWYSNETSTSDSDLIIIFAMKPSNDCILYFQYGAYLCNNIYLGLIKNGVSETRLPKT